MYMYTYVYVYIFQIYLSFCFIYLIISRGNWQYLLGFQESTMSSLGVSENTTKWTSQWRKFWYTTCSDWVYPLFALLIDSQTVKCLPGISNWPSNSGPSFTPRFKQSWRGQRRTRLFLFSASLGSMA